jgi:hypothetical protein
MRDLSFLFVYALLLCLRVVSLQPQPRMKNALAPEFTH